MSATGPKVFTIAPGLSFLDALAHGLLARWGADPLALTRVRVFLPTRRACRALGEAFLRASDGQALVLPQLMPLGDLEADELLLATDEPGPSGGLGAGLPPTLAPLRRQLLLTRLILAWAAKTTPLGEDQAARLASELARLVDQTETEGLDFAGLACLVPEDYAVHWQTTLKFLKIVTEQWPAIEREAGVIGPAARRRLLLEAQAEAWRRNPPRDPVVVAGSTASIPATAALIAAVAGLPQGLVVLPGLDRSSDGETWAAMAEDSSCPQNGLARLLDRLELTREQVADWPAGPLVATAPARAWFVNRALWPAERTGDWQAQADPRLARDAEQALTQVRRLDCPGPREEALAIALLLRQALELPERRAALVTPDRGLARRVAVELRRWGVEVDDSAGLPLADSGPGLFLRATAEMVAQDFAPLALLAALKHPLAQGGLGPGQFRAQVRQLELVVLHGPRPAPGLPALRLALAQAEAAPGLLAWLDLLAQAAAPLVALLGRPCAELGEIVTAHLALAEQLAAGAEQSGPERLWAGQAGDAAAEFCADLLEGATVGLEVTGARYPALLGGLMAERVVRPQRGAHPRLAILGPLEARLQQVDLMILGGLNEATWPAEIDPGPWLSRPMRAAFGLPPPERKLGLAAHDFAQAFAAPEVVLTRATRIEGTPTVPSRWLLRIDALMLALGLDSEALYQDGDLWLAWAETLDQPAVVRPCAPPAPTPPLAARPRRLSVTQVETWMRDPYGLYVRKILGLRRLDPLDADPGVAERGILVHRALELFVKRYPEALPDDPEAALIQIGREVFGAVAGQPGVQAFWWPRFCRIARWVAELEQRRRPEIRRSLGEITGALELAGPAGRFTLSATADRIDRLADGAVAILDYKTGALPSDRSIALGLSPQLSLEAAIAAAGGFGPEIGPAATRRLEYWRLTGGAPAGEVKPVAGEPGALAAAALDGLSRLIASFDNPATPYQAVPRPAWAPRFSDSAHLARVKEWSAAGGREGSS